MIRNLTEAEWGAIVEAVNLYDADLDQNPEAYTDARPAAATRRRILDRALEKVRQLAP